MRSLVTNRGNQLTLDDLAAELLSGRPIHEQDYRLVVTLSLGDLVLMLNGVKRPDDTTVDHIDGDMWNNTLDNLRYADRQTQNINRRKPKTYAGKPTISEYRGVTYTGDTWRAQIRHNGQLHTKRCSTEREAAQWYNDRAQEFRGEAAQLNDL